MKSFAWISTARKSARWRREGSRSTSRASRTSCAGNRAAGRLNFTTDAERGVQFGVIQCIAVGTPPDEDGSADLKHVLAAAASVGRHMSEYRVIVDKSTVPVARQTRCARPYRPSSPGGNWTCRSPWFPIRSS